jgi:Arc/MetJ family transcription regulator
MKASLFRRFPQGDRRLEFRIETFNLFNNVNFQPSQAEMPYQYGTIVCMKKTLHIDDRLLREAKSVSGAKTDTDTVRLGLETLVRHAAYERLRALRGSEPRTRDVPRRRERPASAKHSAA